MDLGVRGKRVLITRAGSGLGRAIAELFAAEGADIAFCGDAAGSLQDTKAALNAKGVQAQGTVIAANDADGYKKWLAAAIESLGGCDIFIANAAGESADSADGSAESAESTDSAESGWKDRFDGLVMHTMQGCDALLEHVKASGLLAGGGGGSGGARSSKSAAASLGVTPTGSIVIVSDGGTATHRGAARRAMPARSAMHAALITYSKQFSQFAGRSGIRCNLIAADLYGSAAAEIAKTVVFLASPAAGLITGAYLANRVDAIRSS